MATVGRVKLWEKGKELDTSMRSQECQCNWQTAFFNVKFIGLSGWAIWALSPPNWLHSSGFLSVSVTGYQSVSAPLSSTWLLGNKNKPQPSILSYVFSAIILDEKTMPWVLIGIAVSVQLKENKHYSHMLVGIRRCYQGICDEFQCFFQKLYNGFQNRYLIWLVLPLKRDNAIPSLLKGDDGFARIRNK